MLYSMGDCLLIIFTVQLLFAIYSAIFSDEIFDISHAKSCHQTKSKIFFKVTEYQGCTRYSATRYYPAEYCLKLDIRNLANSNSEYLAGYSVFGWRKTRISGYPVFVSKSLCGTILHECEVFEGTHSLIDIY